MIEPLLRSVSKVSTQTKAIRKAATLLLVKPGRRLEVFMLQRPGRGTFPNLHVFPGGKVDGADEGLDHRCQGLDDDEASRALGLERGGLCYWVTAIRECFEECGVLLAYRDDASLFAPADANETARFDDYRNALADGDLHMQAMLEREGLHLATDRVRYFSHWITPPSAPARFDTRFFITEMPAGQQAVGHHHETVSGSWVTASQALANHEAERWQMIHPTLTTLETVARYPDAEALLQAVAERRHIRDIGANQAEQGMQRPAFLGRSNL